MKRLLYIFLLLPEACLAQFTVDTIVVKTNIELGSGMSMMYGTNKAVFFQGGYPTFNLDWTPTDGGIGIGTAANGSNGGVALGLTAFGFDDGSAVGQQSIGYDYGSALGFGSVGTAHGVAIGNGAQGSTYGVGIGDSAVGDNHGVSIGVNSVGDTYSVGIGAGAYASSTNISIGHMSQSSSVSGSYNTAIGYNANVTSGNLNTALGSGANFASGTFSNTVEIGSGFPVLNGALHYRGVAIVNGTGVHVGDGSGLTNLNCTTTGLSITQQVVLWGSSLTNFLAYTNVYQNGLLIASGPSGATHGPSLLLESGGYLLLETGGTILKE